MDAFNGTASCLECGDMIYAGLELCDRCSKYLDKCEICCDAADETDINPTLVRAFNSPEAVAARKLAKIGRELQNKAYFDSLAGQSSMAPKRLWRKSSPTPEPRRSKQPQGKLPAGPEGSGPLIFPKAGRPSGGLLFCPQLLHHLVDSGNFWVSGGCHIQDWQTQDTGGKKPAERLTPLEAPIESEGVFV